MSRLALSMSDRTELAERLGLVGRVFKLQAMVTWSMRFLILGLGIDCLWLLGSRLFPYQVRPVLLLVLPASLAVVGGIVAAFWHLSDRRIARRADRELHLKERLTTAVELRGTQSQSPLIGMQLRDAVDQLRRYDALESFPVRLPGRELNALLILAVVAVGLVVAPNPMERAVKQREQVTVAIRQEAERIKKLGDDLAAMEDPEDFSDISQALYGAASEIGDRQLSPEEANAILQRVERDLLSRQDPSVGELDDALNSLAGSLASEAATRDLGTSLARGDLRQAGKDLRRLGQEANTMSAADRLKLSRSLRQTANRTSRSNAAMAQAMTQGSDALENGQSGEAGDALDNLANQLEQSAPRVRAASQRDRALSQLQQSRGAINRSQQANQQRGAGGQRGASQQSGAGDGDSMSDYGGSSGGEGDPTNGDRPGGSSAGTGSGSGDEGIYDPLESVGRQSVVPGQQAFDPNEAYENAELDSPYGNEAQVGYKAVFAQYQERATQTLQNSYIPAGMKDVVKDYFSALAPNK